MAFLPIIAPAPSVSAVPGVPLLNRVGSAVSAITLLASDAALIVRAFNQNPQWGIFEATTGAPVIVADSVLAIDFRREYRVADYPVEQGGFASYDKVAEPFDIRLSFALSGKGTILSNLASGGIFGALLNGDPAVSKRATYLSQIDAMAASLVLYTVITPEARYPLCNVTHYDYRRDARGVSLISVDVWLREVRRAGAATGTMVSLPAAQVQDPAAASPVANGAVQAQPATSDQIQAFSSATVET